ncbi:unnamed protein product [Linum trigynum]|uniref:Uncharacterized protein n=1 Tax=Linum trigynum TaxID=586398 RepID=A0AAV2FB98_9ROSI
MRRAGFFEEGYSAREEESYHSEEEFHSSNASSGGMKLFQPSKCPTRAGHDAAGWNNNINKFNHTFIHEEEAMTGYNRFSDFNDSFGDGYGGHNGCSNADWM